LTKKGTSHKFLNITKSKKKGGTKDVHISILSWTWTLWVSSLKVTLLQGRYLFKSGSQQKTLWRLWFLGVDEVSVRRGHRYLTTVVDIETGRVCGLCGRRPSCRESLAPFFKRLKRIGVRPQKPSPWICGNPMPRLSGSIIEDLPWSIMCSTSWLITPGLSMRSGWTNTTDLRAVKRDGSSKALDICC